jgi:D-sedoheptulose 7-phosphate isomerase
MMKRNDIISARIEESISIKRSLIKQAALIETIANSMVNSIRAGGKVILFGNGGSASDAQHIAAELGGRFLFDRDPLPAIALPANSSMLTAIANDYGYEQVFSRPLRGFAKPGDIVIAISTSGKSVNVITAIKAARSMNLTTVAFMGESGPLKELVDYALCIPSQDTPRIQEAHVMVGHIICELVETMLFTVNP